MGEASIMGIRHLAIMTALLFAANSYAAVWYVDKDATGANNGTSWQNAFTDIQDAVTAATAGDEVWVRAGVYNEVRGGATGSLVMKSNVALYGGFTGTEAPPLDVSTRRNRDWIKNPTIIDGGNGRGLGQPAYHVVVGANNSVLDGFTVRGGRANGSLASDNRGAGLKTDNVGAIIIRNCTFHNNFANHVGGAISSQSSSPTIDRCIFFNNRALGVGNNGNGGGGAINLCGAVGGTAVISTSLFYDNRAEGSGPQAGGGAILNSGHTPTITNCTFTENFASNNTTSTDLGPVNAGGGGAIISFNGGNANVRNSIIWNNAAPQIAFGANTSFGSSGSATVTYSIWEGGNNTSPNNNNLFSNPQFVDAVNNDYRLQAGSPARNSGNNGVAPSRDIVYTNRPLGGTVDRGAYEFDVTAPTCATNDQFIVLPIGGVTELDGAVIGAPSSDAGGILSYTLSQDTVTCADVGSQIQVTLTVEDFAGNTSSCTANIDVVDNFPPTINACASDQTVSFNAQCRAEVPDFTGGVLATDACGVATITQSPAAGSLTAVGNPGPITVTITVTDVNGNTSNCTANLNIIDTTAPTITSCPQDQTLQVDGDCQAVVPNLVGGVLATDNCTSSGNLTITQSPVAGTTISSNTTVTFTVTDQAGNSSQCTAELLLDDTIPPTILSCPPATDNVTADANCEIIIPDYTGAVTAIDNCGIASITQDPAAGSTATEDTLVTVTVTDNSGNTAECTVDVILIDVTDPIITECPPATDTLDLLANCEAIVPDYTGLVVATDSCGIDSITQVPAPGSAIGAATTVTITVSDAAGNTATCTVDVDVVDALGPEITLNGGSSITHECSTPFVDPGFTAIDACEGDVTGDVVVVNPVDENSPVGVYQITYDVVDSLGNAAVQVVREVEVIDTTPPVITLIGDATVTHECGEEYIDLGATALDDCDGNLTGLIDATIPVDENTGVGTYTVSYNVEDFANNQAITVERTVNVVDTTIPVITLIGTPTILVQTGSPYVEQGGDVTDTCDATVSVDITGTVDTGVPGTYQVFYDATDASGNQAVQLVRTVIVQGANNPPVILQQPVDQTVNFDETANFSVTAASATAITYQWFRNGDPLANDAKFSGVTTPNLTVSNAGNPDEGIFHVEVTNQFGTTVSNDATLTVNDPGIVQQPTNQIIPVGTNAVFEVVAVGTPTITYQWFRNGNPLADGGKISGAQTSVLTISDAQESDEGNIYVEVTGADGTIQSDTVVLDVSDPGFLTHPQSQTVDPGVTVQFSAEVLGTPPLVYQWRKNNVNIQLGGRFSVSNPANGESGVSTLTITNVVEGDEGQYRLVVVGQNTVQSNQATLTVNDPPVIDQVIASPSSGVIPTGGSAQLIVTLLRGTPPLTYQWFRNGQPLSDSKDFAGTGTDTLTISNGQTSDAGAYTVTVSNSAGQDTSSPFNILVGLTIVKNLGDRSVQAGSVVNWDIDVQGGLGNLGFQWQKRNEDTLQWENVVNGGGISGATTDTLTFNTVDFDDEGLYRVLVNDDFDNLQTNVARLTVVGQLPAAGGFGLAGLAMAIALGGAMAFRRKKRS